MRDARRMGSSRVFTRGFAARGNSLCLFFIIIVGKKRFPTELHSAEVDCGQQRNVRDDSRC